MIEAIKTFFGRVSGLHQEKQTIVVEGQLWRCTKCKMVFVTKEGGESHDCRERI